MNRPVINRGEIWMLDWDTGRATRSSEPGRGRDRPVAMPATMRQARVPPSWVPADHPEAGPMPSTCRCQRTPRPGSRRVPGPIAPRCSRSIEAGCGPGWERFRPRFWRPLIWPWPIPLDCTAPQPGSVVRAHPQAPVVQITQRSRVLEILVTRSITESLEFTMQPAPAFFEQHQIRRIYDEGHRNLVVLGRGHHSGPHPTAGLQAARKYWNKLRTRLNAEGSESVTNCHRLKFTAARRQAVPHGRRHRRNPPPPGPVRSQPQSRAHQALAGPGGPRTHAGDGRSRPRPEPCARELCRSTAVARSGSSSA